MTLSASWLEFGGLLEYRPERRLRGVVPALGLCAAPVSSSQARDWFLEILEAVF